MTRLIDADELLKNDIFADGCYFLGSFVKEKINNAPTVDKGYDFGYADGHGEGYELGKTSRPQGECEKCDFRKFAETFVDAIVEVMNKKGITSLEQLSEILKGGNEE